MLRVLDISPVNWLILLFYAYNLVRLSLNFRTLYARFALGTTALTNVLLLGLSDTLAQSLRSAAAYRSERDSIPLETPQGSLLRYVLERGRPRQVWLDEAGDDLAELGLADDRESAPEEHAPVDEPDWRDVRRFVAAQVAKVTDFDFRRLLLFSTWGFCVSFAQSPWYKFLRTAYAHDAKLVVVVQRVLADQLFYSPLMLSFFLFYLSTVVERRPWTAIKDSAFWENYVSILSVNLCVWPLAQFVNFLLVPSPAQIPFSSSLSVLWNTHLSLNTK